MRIIGTRDPNVFIAQQILVNQADNVRQRTDICDCDKMRVKTKRMLDANSQTR